MIISCPSLLATFRTPGYCEWCGKWCRVREPAHIFSVGAGRLDIPINLVALGSTPSWECQCHTRHHNGKEPTREQLLDVAAQRNGVRAADIQSMVWLLRRMRKGRIPEYYHAMIVGSLESESAQELAKKILSQTKEKANDD